MNKDSDNYWNSGRNGNMEEYQQYLIIKNRLEGKSARVAFRTARGERIVLTTHYPGSKYLLRVILFFHITSILVVYRVSGLSTAFLMKASYWFFSGIVLYWYFSFRPNPCGTLRLAERCTSSSPVAHALYFYLFLWGWFFSILDLPKLSTWLELSWEALQFLGLNGKAAWILNLNFPTIPKLVTTLGKLTLTLTGTILLLDITASYFLNKER